MGRGSLLLLAAVVSSALVGGAIAETQDFRLYEGDNLTLSCNYNGNANISWTFLQKNGVVNVTVVEELVACNATCNYTSENITSANGVVNVTVVEELVACNATCNYTSENITSANSGVYNCSVEGTVVSTYNVIVTTDNATSTSSESTDAGTTTDNATSTSSESTDAGTTTDNATSTSSESTDAGTTTDNATSTSSESTDAGTATATDNTTSTSSEYTDAGTVTDNATDGTTTDQPAGGSPLNVAAVAGGAAGGVVFLFLIIIIIIFLCRSKRESDVDGIVHRPHKKTAKGGSEAQSKKHRSTILSLRHKLPLFSTPYDEDDDDEEKASDNSEYRPNSKVASQIRVNLEASDDDEGTVENGFVPAKLVTANDEDESPYSMGIVEGRLGIMGPGTFAAANADSEKLDLVNENQNRSDDDDEDAEAETAMNDTYTKVYKSNNPGDASFDNMLYGPIAGVDDKAKASMYDEEQTTENSQALDDKRLTSNETDNACDVDTPNGNVNVGEEGHENGVAKCDSEDTDITKENQNTDRESAAYAEIP